MSDCRFGVSPVNYPDPDPYSFYFDTLRQYGIVYLIFVRVRVGMKLLKELVAQSHCQRQKNMFKLN